MLTKIGRVKVSRVSVALLVASTLAVILGQLFVAAPAKAQCQYEGHTYETGDQIGSRTCMPDGTLQ